MTDNAQPNWIERNALRLALTTLIAWILLLTGGALLV